jgi:hypothetical protein
MVLGMVLLRSKPNPELDLCDCNPNCLLGLSDLVLCAFDGLSVNVNRSVDCKQTSGRADGLIRRFNP